MDRKSVFKPGPAPKPDRRGKRRLSPDAGKEGFARTPSPESAYQSAFAQSRQPLILVGHGGRIIDANLSAAGLLQIELAKLGGREVKQFFADPQEYGDLAKLVGDLGSVSGCPAKMKSAEGWLFHCRVSISPAGKAGQGGQDMLLTLEPEDQLPDMGRQLRSDSEKLFETLFNSAYTAIFIVKDGAYLDCNPSALRMFSCGKQQILGKRPHDFSPPTQPDGRPSPEASQKLFEAAMKGEPQTFEWVHRRHTGEDFYTEVTLNRLPLKSQPHLMALVRDIEAEKRAASALAQSEERFRGYSENSPDIIYTLDCQGAVTYVNPSWQRLLGHRPGEVLGRYLMDFLDPDDIQRYKGLFKLVRDSERNISDLDGKLLGKDGSPRYVSLSASPRKDSSGRVVGLLGTARDITARRMAERQLELQRAYLEQFMEGAPEAIVLLDNRDRVMRVNPEFTRMFGYHIGDAWGATLAELIIPPDKIEEAGEIYARAGRGERVELETVRCRKDGSLVHVSVMGAPLQADGQNVGCYRIFRDITARMEAQEELRQSREMLRLVLDNIPQHVFWKDLDLNYLGCNRNFARAAGMKDPQDLVGLDDYALAWRPEEADFFRQTDQRVIESGQPEYHLMEVQSQADGNRAWLDTNKVPLRDASGKVVGVLGAYEDITARKETEERLRYVAFHDMLTGLPNRKSFYQKLEDMKGPERRLDAEERIWALLFLDLDRFKDINDTLGHDVGDKLLVQVADRLRESVRKTDYVFRLGGDEFTLILNNLKSGIDAARVAGQILGRMKRPFELEGQTMFLSVSIGICVYPSDGTDVHVLMKNADMAMYEAKSHGNSYRFFTQDLDDRARERMRLEANLRHALARDQFRLYYQPMVDHSNVLKGMEALLRWQHPELGTVSPSQFIPVAEETGAIIDIGKWVLYTACKQLNQWLGRLSNGVYVSVNLSPRQFGQPDLVGQIQRALDESGLSPERLRLEVTEGSVIENPNDALHKMGLLHEMGIRFSIDDFGTGYSSLSYLKQFPVEVLKIDRSFVRDAADNADDQQLIRTIIAMADGLRLETVAEGVETREQLDFLASEGCLTMQGYYFGRPMPPNDFIRRYSRKT